MDTGRIKTFAAESRKILKEGVMQRIRALGFDEEGRTPSLPEKVQGGTLYQGRMIENERFYDSWIALNDHIQKLGKNGVRQVYEEAAYTWFNRLIAIRIMQKNHFIEPILSYDDPDIRVPHIVSEARRGRMMCTLTDDEQNRLRNLLMDDTKTQEQFAILIIAYCRENKIISKCFGGIAPYLELLLPDDILSQNRFIDLLNNTNDYITDEQFQSAELIGWLYQFYISERKDEVFASFKSGKKAEAEDIPAATQIFTPNWIVKYMVQNTVGRIYLDNNPYCPLKKDWKYLVEPAEKTPKEAILNIDNLEDLTLADLACGSGHILVEGFDILYSLYIDEGYSRYDAIKNIFTKNLTGIDLDTRAKQLATFALLLKAAQIDPTFLNGEIMPRIYDMPKVDRYTWRDLNGHMTCALQIQGPNEKVFKEIDECFTLMEQAQNLGSIMKFNISDITREFIIKCVDEQNRQHLFEESFSDLFHGFYIILALTEKHAALAMNPPYMGSGNMNAALSKYVAENYPTSKNDLFSIFMDVAVNSLHQNGKYGMINMQAWMYNTYFRKHREKLLETQQLDNVIHLGPHTFDELSGEIVQNVSFIITKHAPVYPGIYYRLVSGSNCTEKERLFLSKSNVYKGISQNRFAKITESPLGSYWATDNIMDMFVNNPQLSTKAEPCVGLQTGGNNLYIRFWYEVSNNMVGYSYADANAALASGKKWFPCNKGGGQRKWYGNQSEIINWQDNGKEVKNHNGAVIRNEHCYFRPSVSWNMISGSYITFRYFPEGFILNNASNAIPVTNPENLLAFLSSKISTVIANILNATTNLSNGVVARFPYLTIKNETILNDIRNNINISKQDWDAHETSWDFETNPLLICNDVEIEEEGETVDLGVASGSLKMQYEHYKAEWTNNFKQLHINEEELNRQFIEIYGLQDELTPDVPLDEITILQQGEISIEDNQIKWHADVVMKQLISYTIGCMMGRYRLDKPGLCIAHPNPDESEYAPYRYHDSLFEIDEDGIIPLMQKDSRFDDNAVNRFTDFIKIVFGEETLTENMNFLEESLGKSVEQYLIKDFWKDHKKMYQNRPIYWLFSSKKGAFQVIAYMHRMNKYTVENIRNKYLLPHIDYLRQEIADLDSRITALSTQERKLYQKLQKDLEECMEYHDRLHMVADQQIAFDLDDGVVVNYAKFGDVLAKLK